LQKLSWHYLIQGNEAQYHFYKNLIKLKGKAINEDDKLAELYTNKPMPHVDLLKTRMLYDGGYIEKAYAIIKPLRSKDFGNSFQKAEYAYRKARIHEAMNQIDLAIKFYEFASIYGEDSPEYYASYACLYLGDHSLKQGDSITAREWYKQALSYEKNLEYKSSIEQWAKRGLKQCDS
jgi:tetratricopeptide (TPR) repeat protein